MSGIPTTFDKETPRFDKNPQDFYVTDPRLVDACLERIHALVPAVENFVDPGCGSGNWGRAVKKCWPQAWGVGVDIVDRLEEDGAVTYEYFFKRDFTTNIDDEYVIHNTYDLVIGNPPFSSKTDKTLARKFIQNGLKCLNEFGLLGFILKTEALHSVDRYEYLFRDNPPIETWICVQRPGWYGDGTTNTIEYAFFHLAEG